MTRRDDVCAECGAAVPTGRLEPLYWGSDGKARVLCSRRCVERYDGEPRSVVRRGPGRTRGKAS
jgi:hypothetical protein